MLCLKLDAVYLSQKILVLPHNQNSRSKQRYSSFCKQCFPLQQAHLSSSNQEAKQQSRQQSKAASKAQTVADSKQIRKRERTYNPHTRSPSCGHRTHHIHPPSLQPFHAGHAPRYYSQTAASNRRAANKLGPWPAIRLWDLVGSKSLIASHTSFAMWRRGYFSSVERGKHVGCAINVA